MKIPWLNYGAAHSEQNKNTFFILSGLAKVLSSDIPKCWQGCRSSGIHTPLKFAFPLQLRNSKYKLNKGAHHSGSNIFIENWKKLETTQISFHKRMDKWQVVYSHKRILGRRENEWTKVIHINLDRLWELLRRKKQTTEYIV